MDAREASNAAQHTRAASPVDPRFLCVRVYVCVCVRARACVCVCVCFPRGAVKELLSGGNIADLLVEVEAMRKLYHPNLLATIGLASDFTTHLGLVMEFLPASLYSLLHSGAYRDAYRGHLTWARCFLALSTDVALGFEYLHLNGFVHRDLKPHNVLVSAAWHAKVADFGEAQREAGKSQACQPAAAMPVGGDSSLAGSVYTQSHRPAQGSSPGWQRSLASGASNTLVSGTSCLTTATTTGMKTSTTHEKDTRVHGTAPYLSPEAASAGTEQQVDVGPPTDVWGFGCMLAHIAARAPPYAGVFTKPREVVYALRDGTAKPLAQMTAANTPTKLRDIAARCCTWKPEERPSFSEIGQLLKSSDIVRTVCGELAICDDEEDSLDSDSTGGGSFEAARPEPRLKWLVADDAPRKEAQAAHVVCKDNEVDPVAARAPVAASSKGGDGDKVETWNPPSFPPANQIENKEGCAVM